jgi:hypothetical protein
MNPIAFAQRLHGPLLKALNEGVPGFEFGARMILHEGALAYGWLASQPTDRILSLIQAYPPMWADLLRYGSQAETFLEEFRDQEQSMQLAEEMRMGRMPPPAPSPRPAGPAPVTPAPGPTGSPTGGRKVTGPDGKPIEVLMPDGSPVPPAKPRTKSPAGGPVVNRPAEPPLTKEAASTQ